MANEELKEQINLQKELQKQQDNFKKQQDNLQKIMMRLEGGQVSIDYFMKEDEE